MSNTSSNSGGQQKSNPQSSKTIWNRVGHVEVLIWNGDKAQTYDFDGLDFKFSVTQILGRMPEGNMSVSICGLSQDTANKLITVCNISEALKQRKTLKLYAGYADPEDKNYKGELLAVMDIINATIVSPPPDIWLQITAVYAGWLNDMKFSINIMDVATEEEVDEVRSVGYSLAAGSQTVIVKKQNHFANYVLLSKCLKEICDGLNKLNDFRKSSIRYRFDMSRVASRMSLHPGKTRQFYFSGTLADIPKKISETYKVLAIWEARTDNDIYLAVYPDPNVIHNLSEEDKKAIARGNTIKFLDVDHGLIGIPKLRDAIKLECRCFLDGKIKAGDYVSVRSEMIPAIYANGENIKPSNKSLAAGWGSSNWRTYSDGDKKGQVVEEDQDTIKAYQIMSIKYSGHLRGNEWYCDIAARRPSMVISDPTEKFDTKTLSIELVESVAKKFKGWEINEKTGAMTKK